MTSILAIYGAVVGTAALALSIYLAVRDRAVIQVLAGPDDPARADFRPSTDGETRTLVHVRNRGRRAVSIERIWYTRRSKGGDRFLLTDRFDRGTVVLEEGQGLTYELLASTVRAEELGRIVVEAQDGRRWSGTYDGTLKPLRWA